MLRYIVLCFLFSQIEGVIYKYVTEDSVLQLRCTYENECAEDDIIIQAVNGYKMFITMKSLDVDSGSGDFVLVKSGTTLDDDFTGRIFAYHITEEREFLSFTENVLIHFQINTESNKENYAGFTLTAELYGEQSTTPEPTTTDVPWPTISDDETPYISVNMTIVEYDDDIVDVFINTVVEMATYYVASQTDFELTQEISTDNVHMSKIIQCPMYWRNSETCYQFTFALPLLLAEDSEHYGSYQLNETHLYAMWQNASNYFGHSTNSNLYLYEMPATTRIITIWVSIICSVTLAFGVVYLICGYQCVGYLLKKKKKRALLDNQSDTTSDGKRGSISSLTPHPLQTVPPLFDSDMPYFEPDSPSYYRPSALDNSNDLRQRELRDRQFIFDGSNLRETTDS